VSVQRASNHGKRLAGFALVACVVFVSTAFARSGNVVVTVDPFLGRRVGQVSVVMTREEQTTVRRMEREISAYAVGAPPVSLTAEWLIESAARDSRTLGFSQAVLRRAQVLFEKFGLVRLSRTYIVIARTQRFINETLAALDCYPNLVRTGGVHLMGEAVCNRSVIVINLTGYYFLRSAGDVLTERMESLPEPAFNRLNYRIADRNISGLAHEWAHIVRASATDGAVAADEPAWMREGFAEVMAGIARVQAFSTRMSYSTFHVVRLRKFADWGNFCTASLRRYRIVSDFFAGCEYYLGALAVEYLIAWMGGLTTLASLYRTASASLDFSQAFRSTYGMTLDAFEQRMDTYLRAIADLPEV
jgi:hypothetical protein